MLPPEFVYLAQTCNTIRQDIRYAGCQNFTGKKVNGYKSNVAILTKSAADQLALVQKDLESRKLGLLVFDAYRPKRAVDSFLRWKTTETDDRKDKEIYYPDYEKDDLFRIGFIHGLG